MPANLVFRRKIWGARDNGIPPRSTPDMFLKSDKHNSCVYLLKVTFMSKNLFDTQGTKNCSLIEMYS